MHTLTMHLDFVSPYAWLAFQALPDQLRGMSCHVQYRPVYLAAVLRAHGHAGPAGIPAKVRWIQQHVQWLAQQSATPLHMPPQHPFHSLPLLCLALQASRDGCISRYVAECVFRHVWESGQDPLDPLRMEALQTRLQAHQHDVSDPAEHAKQLLRSNTEQALAQGVFGVPSLTYQEQIFWGLDSLPMLRDTLLRAATAND